MTNTPFADLYKTDLKDTKLKFYQEMGINVDKIDAKLKGNSDSIAAHVVKSASDDVHGLGFRGAYTKQSVNQSIPSASAVVLNLSTEVFDTDNCFDLSTPTRLTCKTSGKYFVGCNVRYTENSTGILDVLLRKNGVFYFGYYRQSQNAKAVGFSQVSGLVELVVGDYVEVMLNQDSGTSINTLVGDNLPAFYMYKVGN